MKKRYSILLISVFITLFTYSQSVNQNNSSEPSFKNKNNLMEALQPLPKQAIFKMEGYYIWVPSVIKVGKTYHLFASRWPAAEGMIGWKKSHIIRATSSSLFGPYKFAQVASEPKNHPFATQGMHNPKITKVAKYMTKF